MDKYFDSAVSHLKNVITVPSFSNEEDKVADLWESWLKSQGAKDVRRFHNNVYALTEKFDAGKPILLLNSHLDTVKPVSSYTFDPFFPIEKDGKIYGLGSNDAGGAGVALAVTFLENRLREDLPFNLLLAITASEERMGELGMRAFLPHLREQNLYPSMAIVGEPTSCKAAIAERGLVVCDVEVIGKSGHAARNEGINALYRACDDIQILRNLKWPRESEVLGPVNVSVTMINSGTQHNVVPDTCRYVADIRTTDVLSNEETVDFLQKSTHWSRFTPRSVRIRASVLKDSHSLAQTARQLGMETFVSPTTSDMALMYDIPSIKIGPGESARSHTADEYIEIHEIKEGVDTYRTFINALAEKIRSNN